jgi:hypothetical protein
MGTFEYAMVLVSIVIGLGVTHLLSGIGQSIHRLGSSESPIKLEPTYLFWVGFVFIYLVSFWWWEYKFSVLDIVWSLDLYYFIILYAVVFYLITTVLVPWQMQGISSALEHFMHKRAWFFGLLIVAVSFDIVDTFLKGTDWGLRQSYVVFVIAQVAVYVTAIWSTSRKLHLVMAGTMFSWQLIYSILDLEVLGAF